MNLSRLKLTPGTAIESQAKGHPVSGTEEAGRDSQGATPGTHMRTGTHQPDRLVSIVPRKGAHMKGQTALTPCAFCSEPATHEDVEIIPALERTRSVPGSDGKPLTAKVIVRQPTRVALCDVHHQHHLDQQGWQDRAEEKRKINTAAAKERLKRDQINLFDTQPSPFEDAA